MSIQSTNPGESVLTNVQGVNGIYGTSGGVSLRLPARASGSHALPIGADPDVESNPLVLAHG